MFTRKILVWKHLLFIHSQSINLESEWATRDNFIVFCGYLSERRSTLINRNLDQTQDDKLQ